MEAGRRGPAAAVQLTLRYLRWDWPAPHAVRTHMGELLDMREQGPKEIEQVAAHKRIVGFMFCGDANCNRTHWFTALLEAHACEKYFAHPRDFYANSDAVPDCRKRKAGDATVVFSVKGQQSEGVQEDYRVWNRDATRCQHRGGSISEALRSGSMRSRRG